MKGLFDALFREKPVLALISLKKNDKFRYPSNLAKEIKCTYSHMVKLLRIFEKYGLIQFKKKGKVKFVSLTKQGKELATYLEKAHRLIKKL